MSTDEPTGISMWVYSTKILRLLFVIASAVSIPIFLIEFFYTSNHGDAYRDGPRQRLVAKHQGLGADSQHLAELDAPYGYLDKRSYDAPRDDARGYLGNGFDARRKDAFGNGYDAPVRDAYGIHGNGEGNANWGGPPIGLGNVGRDTRDVLGIHREDTPRTQNRLNGYMPNDRINDGRALSMLGNHREDTPRTQDRLTGYVPNESGDGGRVLSIRGMADRALGMLGIHREETPIDQDGLTGYVPNELGNDGRALSDHGNGDRALNILGNGERALSGPGDAERARSNPDNGAGLIGGLLGTEDKRCVKTIHIFADREYFDIPEELQQFSYIVDHDPMVDCGPLGRSDCLLKFSISAKISDTRGKDAVVFGMNGAQWTFRRNYYLLESVVQMQPEPGQTFIYYTIEPPFRTIRWSESLKTARMHYHVLMSYNRQSDVPLPFGYFRKFSNTADGGINSVVRTSGDAAYLHAVQRNRTGLLTWVSSNCDDVVWPRLSFVQRLRKLLPFDTYGKCGHLECLPKRSEHCKNLLSSYKFYLAMPNAECDDYITEKFWDYALAKGTVPVVYGARKQDYEAIAPPNSFIHAADFSDLEHLAEFLLMLDRNDALYAKFHEWRKYGDVRGLFPTPSLFCSAVPMIKPHAPEELKVLGESPWYMGCRETPGERHMTLTKRDFPLTSWSMWR